MDGDGDDVDHKHHLRRKDLERTVIVMLLKMMVGTVWMVLVISEDADDDLDGEDEGAESSPKVDEEALIRQKSPYEQNFTGPYSVRLSSHLGFCTSPP